MNHSIRKTNESLTSTKLSPNLFLLSLQPMLPQGKKFLVVLPILSGLLFWASWPEGGIPYLLFFAFVPLLWMEVFIARLQLKRPELRVFFLSAIAFGVWNTGTTYWIYFASLVGAIAAILINTILMSSVWTLFFIAKKRLGGVIGYTSLIILWLAFEYLHLHWEISWPWLTLGFGLSEKIEWIQWIQFTGVLGASLWLLLANLLIFFQLKNIFNGLIWKIKRINVAILTVSVALWILTPIYYSLHLYHHHHDSGENIHVAVIQPNVDPYNEKFSGSSYDQLVQFLQLSSTVLNDSSSLLIGPETALPEGIFEDQMVDDEKIKLLQKYLEGYKKVDLLTGLSSYRNFAQGEKLSATARKYKDGHGYYDAFNTAMLLNKEGKFQLYHKSKLVPGVEQLPYPAVFGFLGKYAVDLGGISGSLGKQEERTVFNTSSGIKVAPVICYESIYGDFVRRYIQHGAEMIAIITNDGWWHNTQGHKQHLLYARLLAVEFRKSIARSANTGISCFINQRGDISKATKYWEADAIESELKANDTITFYARHGDYIGWLSAVLAVSVILILTVLKFVRRK